MFRSTDSLGLASAKHGALRGQHASAADHPLSLAPHVEEPGRPPCVAIPPTTFPPDGVAAFEHGWVSAKLFSAWLEEHFARPRLRPRSQPKNMAIPAAQDPRSDFLSTHLFRFFRYTILSVRWLKHFIARNPSNPYVDSLVQLGTVH